MTSTDGPEESPPPAPITRALDPTLSLTTRTDSNLFIWDPRPTLPTQAGSLAST